MNWDTALESSFTNREIKSLELENILNSYDSNIQDLFKTTSDIEIIEEMRIPKSDSIPFENPKKWLKVKNVTCLFIDLANSSILDYKNHTKRVTQIYQGFTDVLVKIMNCFNASYIDIKGDGAFALFDTENSYVNALLASITFRTYFEKSLKPIVMKATNQKIVLSFRSGITYGDVIFKRMGLRGDKKNEVWTNSTVNNCAKLTSLSENDNILVTSEIYNKIKNNRYLTQSCGCTNGIRSDEYSNLWKEKEYSELSIYGSPIVYELGSSWCENCGEEFLNEIIKTYKLKL